MGGRGAPGLVAVIPALNASATIGPVVAGTLEHVPRVVVVDDGSTDDTAVRAGAAGAEVIRHAANRGKGAALRTAFEHLLGGRRASGAPDATKLEGVVTLDADGQHDPGDIPLFVDLFQRLRPAIIVGSRARHFGQMWGPRRAMNRFSSASLRFFAGTDLPDSQSGFRLYDARFLERLPPTGARYEAEMEALMQAAGLGLRIDAVPIRLPVVDGRATSHFRPLLDTLRICASVIRLFIRQRLGGATDAPPEDRRARS